MVDVLFWGPHDKLPKLTVPELQDIWAYPTRDETGRFFHTISKERPPAEPARGWYARSIWFRPQYVFRDGDAYRADLQDWTVLSWWRASALLKSEGASDAVLIE
jgi:hypothetical protein